MVDKNKLSKDFEEQIQSLAGDIYIQVEEKVSSMLTIVAASHELTDEKVEQHTHYIKLKESQQATQTELEKAKVEIKQQIEDLQKEKTQLIEKLTISEVELKKLAEVNGSKHSDNEVLLKEKLDEISTLNNKLAAFIKLEPETIKRIASAEKQVQELIENKAKLEQAEALLIKSDSAKVVALDLQSKQISELHLKVETTNSELEQLQLEQSKLLEKKASNLGEEKKQITVLNEKTAQLDQQIVQLNEQLAVEIKTAEEKQQKIAESDQQQQKTIQALNKEEDALIAIIASYKEKELAGEESLKQQNADAENSKKQLDTLTAELTTEKQKLAEQTSLLQTLKQENSEQDKNQLVSADKVIALELANAELQNQRDNLQEGQQKSSDKLQMVGKDYQEQISTLNDKLSSDEKRFTTDNQLLKDTLAALETEKQSMQEQLNETTSKLESSEADLVNEKSGAGQYQENLVALEEQLKEAKSEKGNTQQRIDSAKAKFDSDSDQAREMIKNLRDENHEITTKFEQRIGELEDKLTEYRLRFEYAQRQLAKNEG